MASRAEKMVKSLAVESRVEYYIAILTRTRRLYERTFSSGSYPEKLKRDTLEFIDIVIGKLTHVRSLIGRYRSSLQPFYLTEALREIRGLRYHLGVGAVSSSLADRVGTIVSELEMELRKLSST